MNRKKRYYENRIKGKATCPECGGPMTNRKKHRRCRDCQNKIGGDRLARISIERSYE